MLLLTYMCVIYMAIVVPHFVESSVLSLPAGALITVPFNDVTFFSNEFQHCSNTKDPNLFIDVLDEIPPSTKCYCKFERHPGGVQIKCVNSCEAMWRPACVSERKLVSENIIIVSEKKSLNCRNTTVILPDKNTNNISFFVGGDGVDASLDSVSYSISVETFSKLTVGGVGIYYCLANKFSICTPLNASSGGNLFGMYTLSNVTSALIKSIHEVGYIGNDAISKRKCTGSVYLSLAAVGQPIPQKLEIKDIQAINGAVLQRDAKKTMILYGTAGYTAEVKLITQSLEKSSTIIGEYFSSSDCLMFCTTRSSSCGAKDIRNQTSLQFKTNDTIIIYFRSACTGSLSFTSITEKGKSVSPSIIPFLSLSPRCPTMPLLTIASGTGRVIPFTELASGVFGILPSKTDSALALLVEDIVRIPSVTKTVSISPTKGIMIQTDTAAEVVVFIGNTVPCLLKWQDEKKTLQNKSVMAQNATVENTSFIKSAKESGGKIFISRTYYLFCALIIILGPIVFLFKKIVTYSPSLYSAINRTHQRTPIDYSHVVPSDSEGDEMHETMHLQGMSETHKAGHVQGNIIPSGYSNLFGYNQPIRAGNVPKTVEQIDVLSLENQPTTAISINNTRPLTTQQTRHSPQSTVLSQVSDRPKAPAATHQSTVALGTIESKKESDGWDNDEWE
eukprot:Tbor_TRINITY_DN6022_c0_g4::TRINITY_DN6022_c0_g4_i1::g.10603::m.10603